MLSPGNEGMRLSAAGRWSESPKRSSNSEAPSAIVIVSRPSSRSPKPSSPVSDGGSALFAIGSRRSGWPCVSSAIRSVRSRNSSGRSSVTTSKAATIP